MPRRIGPLCVVLMLLSACGEALADRHGADAAAQGDPTDRALALFDPALFEAPPREHAPGLRWAWPGGAVEDETVAEQVALFAQAGYGSVEVQPMTLALRADQVAADARIRTVGEPFFFDRLRALAGALRRHGLTYDLTLGSGWPNAGPGLPSELGEQQIFWSRSDVSGPAALDLPLPPPHQPGWMEEVNGLLPDTRITAHFDSAVLLEAVLAAPLLDTNAQPPLLGTPVEVTQFVVDGRLRWSAPAGRHAIVALYRNRTNHIPLKAAFPGAPNDARVVDHLDRGGARWLIEHQVKRWVSALAEARPRSFFVDSFELTGELPWSPGLVQRYQQRVGRTPFADMPFFFREGSETMYVEKLRAASEPVFASHDPVYAVRVREDYEAVRAQAFAQEFVQPLAEGLREHGVGLRMQAHGGWGFALDDYALADVPESEGLYAGGSFDFLTLAASAAHVAARREVSSEAFTTLNLLTGARLLDESALWKLSGLAYTAGINHLVHSWCAYPYTTADGQPWSTHDSDPGTPGSYTLRIEPGSADWAFLPSFNRAQTRVQYALSRGEPRVDVAWLKSARDHRDLVQLAVGSLGTHASESLQSSELRAASYTYDRISPSALAAARYEEEMLAVGAGRYRALLVDEASVIEPGALAAIVAAEGAGLPVVWVGSAPLRALGSGDAIARDARVAELWTQLEPGVVWVDDPRETPAALRTRGVAPEIKARGTLSTIGVLQRRVAGGRVVWLFNESDLPQSVNLTLRWRQTSGLALDPASGLGTPVEFEASGSDSLVTLALPALRGVILWLSR